MPESTKQRAVFAFMLTYPERTVFSVSRWSAQPARTLIPSRTVRMPMICARRRAAWKERTLKLNVTGGSGAVRLSGSVMGTAGAGVTQAPPVLNIMHNSFGKQQADECQVRCRLENQIRIE